MAERKKEEEEKKMAKRPKKGLKQLVKQCMIKSRREDDKK